MSYVLNPGSGGGDTYTLRAAQDGSDVDIQLDAAAGADSEVKLKAGTNITLTEASDTVTIDSAGAGGSIGVNQVAFGDPSSAGDIKGSDNFTFVDESGSVGADVKISGDRPTFTLEDDTEATDYKSIFRQSGSSGYWVHADSTGVDRQMIRVAARDIIINEAGDDVDVRIEGQSNSNLLRTHAVNNEVGIGVAPTSGEGILQVGGALQVKDEANFQGEIRLNGAAGTAGQVLTSAGSGADPIWDNPSGGGSPGGSNGQIQFNDGGSFGGNAAMTFDDTAGAEQIVFQGTSTANPLVRITQAGSGDALIVEDSTNPDSTQFKVTERGDVTIGTSSEFLGKLRVSGTSGNRVITSPSGTANVVYRFEGPSSALEQMNLNSDSGNTMLYNPYVDGEYSFMRRDGVTNQITTSFVISTEDTIKLGLGGQNYGTAGQVLTSGGPNAAASWSAASGGAAFAPTPSVYRQTSPRTSLTGLSPYGFGDFQSNNQSTNNERIYFAPFIAAETVTIDTLDVYTQTSSLSSSSLLLGIYTSTEVGSGANFSRCPDALQMTATAATTVSGYSGGAVSAASGGSTTINKGELYYVAYAPVAASGLASSMQTISTNSRCLLGISTGNAPQTVLQYLPYSYGDGLALSFPTTYLSSTTTTGSQPLHMMYTV